MSEQSTEIFALHDEVDDDAVDLATTQTAGASVLDALRAARAHVAESQTYDLVVPGWRNLLVLRLGAVSAGQQQRIVERATKPGRGPGAADPDFLVAAFRQALGRATPHGELGVLVDEDGDEIGLDKRLAEMFDLGPVSRARDVALALFQFTNSPPMALSAEMTEWAAWARSASGEIDEDYLGE